MKLSVAIAPSGAPDSAFVVWRGIEENAPKAARFGYHGIELALSRAEEINVSSITGLICDLGLEISCISTGQVFAVLGLYFTHPDPEKRRMTVEVFKGLVDLASEFGGLINVGRARGSYCSSQSRHETEELFVETAREICDYAAGKDVTLMIEPVNRYEINFINTVAEADLLIGRIARPNASIMPDLFHMNIEDPSIGETLENYVHRISYIHLADSNRRYPGAGHLNFSDIFASLEKISFKGWASVEILPHPDPDTAAEQAAATLLPLIQRPDSALSSPRGARHARS